MLCMFILALVATAAGQYVSPYAAGIGAFSGVLPQYLSGSYELPNRQGQTVSSSQAALEDRISQLPPDRQPYWYINKDVLQAIKQQPVPVVYTLIRPVGKVD